MAEHPIQGLMNVTMEKIHQMVDSNTIIGKPITTEDGITILPVSKVSFGFASGGTDFDGKNAANKDLFGGGSGAGVNIQPVAFLVIKDGCVRTIQLSDTSNTIDRALTMLPELVDKLAAMVKKDDKAPEAAPAEKYNVPAGWQIAFSANSPEPTVPPQYFVSGPHFPVIRWRNYLSSGQLPSP